MTFLCTPDLSVKQRGSLAELSPIRCKRWSCPHCKEINRSRVIGIARRAKPRALLTLTVSSSHYDSPDEAAFALKRGLRLLRLRISREHPEWQFSFLAVFERHSSGYPHLHLLIRGKYIPWQWLKSVWQSITGSIHVDIRRISSEGKAAYYVSKYIGKDLSGFANCKRWWRSHEYSEEDTEEYTPDYTQPAPRRYVADLNLAVMCALGERCRIERRAGGGVSIAGPPDGPLPLDLILAVASGASRPVGKPTFRRASAL